MGTHTTVDTVLSPPGETSELGAFKPVGGRLITPTTIALAALVAIAFFFLAKRFLFGLGSVANINDGYPWGIWVALDVVVGTAFACGGYAMALLVYIFNKGEYHPLVRPALLASMFGYTLGGMAVVVDLGRYWNIWHMFAPGYAHLDSVMLEVGLCVAAYVMVLWIEFSPAIFHRFGMKNANRVLNKVLFFFIALGILLPTMHQSSLGTLLVVFGNQLHPLWQTTLLPALFLTSALTMGFSIVIFEASLAAAGFKQPSETRILKPMTRIIAWMLAIWSAVRIAEIVIAGEAALMFTSGGLSVMFWLEMALFIIPAVILFRPANQGSARLQFIAACTMLAAGSLYRINGFLIAYQTGDGWNYFPSVPEIMVTVGMIALEILAYIIFVKVFPVLHSPKRAPLAAVKS